jgi:hypothetical protein
MLGGLKTKGWKEDLADAWPWETQGINFLVGMSFCTFIIQFLKQLI